MALGPAKGAWSGHLACEVGEGYGVAPPAGRGARGVARALAAAAPPCILLGAPSAQDTAS
eukprot:CAMPEP_0168452586 /NCGR_PEP_ID=MMETSP0228-20121227/49238_1 /TAXON_ID=133427 /ORGANISM="Protoceratium reticulatum, Strain CCCM 535 (=CCMP 1889)" /LENGTH=59 /DNA_ID=CAMNT_0008467259 /DNA_START=131 /DNA_END=306 /DNA_ORIENTATION=+